MMRVLLAATLVSLSYCAEDGIGLKPLMYVVVAQPTEAGRWSPSPQAIASFSQRPLSQAH